MIQNIIIAILIATNLLFTGLNFKPLEQQLGASLVYPYQGGTGQDFSNATGTIRVDGGVFSTSTSVGSGDVTSVGDCADGACYDGTSDGGTYLDFYDAQGLTRLIGGNNTSQVTITLPTATGTLIYDGGAFHDGFSDFVANEHFLQSAITEVGTIATGVWNGTAIDSTYIASSTEWDTAYGWGDWSGSVLWTDGGTFTYLTATTDDVVFGAASTTGYAFLFDVSAGDLTATGTITANDLTIPDNSVDEADINFSTACAAGNHYYLSGNDLACESDDDTTYTATNPITLVGTAFGIESASTTEWDTAYSWGDWNTNIDISTDTNLATGTGVSLTGDTIGLTLGEIDHDSLLNFTANEHFLQSAITEVGTIGTGVWNGTAILNAYIASSTEFLVDNNTTYLGGTNLTLAGTTFNVDDPFVVTDLTATNATITALIATLTGNADTATALAANGANCAAGSYALGVDDAGAVESCTDASTEIDSIVATHTGDNDAHQALVTLAGQDYLTLSAQAITAGEIEPDDLAISDFGFFNCDGTTCTIDAETINSAQYVDASIDHEHLAPDTISGLTDVTSVDADYIIIWDATDSALKRVDMGEVRGAGSSLFTDGGTSTYLTSTTDDLAIGGTATNSPLFMDVSAEELTVGTTGPGDSVLDFYASSTRAWTVGMDDDDGDDFKIATSSDFSTGIAIDIDWTTLAVIMDKLTLTGDNSTADTAYVPNILYNTDATPPAASGFPIGTLYVEYTP